MVVLSQAGYNKEHPGSGDIERSTVAAATAGLEVYRLPLERHGATSLSAALSAIPHRGRRQRQRGFLIGFSHSVAFYDAVCRGAHARGVDIVNAPSQCRELFEFHRAYEKIHDLTMESVAFRSIEEVDRVAEHLGFPLFVRGTVSSRRGLGWGACVAPHLAALTLMTERLLAAPHHSRGVVIARRLEALELWGEDPFTQFPLSREFRAFVYQQKVVNLGFYWPYVSNVATLTLAEENTLRMLAENTAARFDAPWVCVDIAQKKEGGWVVVTVDDPQFCKSGWMDPVQTWQTLRRRVAR